MSLQPNRKSVFVLELLKPPVRRPWQALEGLLVRRQSTGLAAQAIAVWARRRGHDVRYAVYEGVGDPLRRIGEAPDVLLIACHTPLAPLACALAAIYRRRGSRTVIGGPHARSFPAESAAHFDVTVLDCDENLLDEVIHGRFPRGSVVTTARPPRTFPSLAERMPYVRASTFYRGRPLPNSEIPMLASTGCPYGCDFCVDARSTYRSLPTDRLAADLRFAADHLPGVPLFFHDPNFGVRFDEHLAAIEADAANPYVIETSLSTLNPARLRRLAATGCRLLATGIESWSGYGAKAGLGQATGAAKLDQVLDRLEGLRRHVPFVQATFILGLDVDQGAEPFELAAEFTRRAPWAWPYFNLPFAYGGTPWFESIVDQGRLLGALPFSFYHNPQLTLVLAHYEAADYLERMADLHDLAASPRLLRARLRVAPTAAARAEHVVRTVATRPYVSRLRRLAAGLRADRSLRAFHRGEGSRLPESYRHAYARALGHFAELVPPEDCRPILDRPSPQPIVVDAPTHRTVRLQPVANPDG